MKILLTNPVRVMKETPTLFGAFQPLGLMYIASCLEKEGHEVKIIDTVVDKSVKKWINILKNFDPDLVGIAGVVSTIYSAWDTAELVKKHSNAKVVMGGDHVTFLPGETLSCCPYVDYVIRGEGEITTVELTEHLAGKRKINAIKGLSYRKDDNIIHNPPRPWIKDLDKLPYPAWHLVDMYKYTSIIGYAATFISSRGCPQGCSFCSTSRKCGLLYRPRTAESVVKEMNELWTRYPKLDKIVSIDDNLMWNVKRVEEICDLLIKQGSDRQWICQGRADTVVRGGARLLDKMKKAGCFAIQIGVESPSENRLKAINKGITKNKSIEAVKLTEAAGIQVRATFVFGFPDETKEEIKKTIRFAKEIKASYAQFMILTACPGSPFFEETKHNLASHDWRRFTGQHYLFEHSYDIEKELNKAYLKFNVTLDYLKLSREIKIKKRFMADMLFYPIVKAMIGSHGDPLYDFDSNKWLDIDEEYWQNFIIKHDLTFETTWYHDKPIIEKITRLHTKPSIYRIPKSVLASSAGSTKWIRMG